MANPIRSNPTQELFPGMLQTSRILIIDYDVTRFHSFDIFRYLLLDREFFRACDPTFLPLIKESNPLVQLQFYIKHVSSINPFENFTHLKDMKLVDMENRFKELLPSEAMVRTHTDIYHRLGLIFDRDGITGYLLRYPFDKTEIPWINKVKVFTSEHMLDLRMAAAIIDKFRINTVFISSIEAAILLCAKLDTMEYDSPISFIVGSYGYNFDPEIRAFKHLREMNAFEYTKKHEFGIFSPFSGLLKE